MENVEYMTNSKEETDARIERMYKELTKEHSIRLFPNTKKYNMMIVFRSIDWASNCEHHKVGIVGKAYIGYIPNDKYYAGASKLARIVHKYLNLTTYVTQEDANMNIVNTIQETLDPKGIICVLVGKHGCMTHRGVCQPNSDMITSEIRGLFVNEPETRAEFFELLKLQKVN